MLKLLTPAIVIGSFTSSINHTEEIAAMNKSVEELHNQEDLTSFMDALKFFFGLILLCCVRK
ncbi:MAG TPA: hypothetical protein VMV70_00525 [Gallionella sp.]|nr:hypothetical protein [Gallionella sp.]